MRILLTLAACLLSALSMAKNLNEQQLTHFTAHTKLHFAVLSNTAKSGSSAQITLSNHSDITLPAGRSNWRVYFHSVRKIAPVTAHGLTLTHVQGDLHQMRPTAKFKGLKPGASVSVVYQPAAWMVSYTDFMPRAFMVLGNPRGKHYKVSVFANTDTENISQYVDPIIRPEQEKRSSADHYPIATAASRYKANAPLASVDTDAERAMERIIPTPRSVNYHHGEAHINKSWQIRYAGALTSEAHYLRDQLPKGLSLTAKPDNIAAAGPTIILALASGKNAPGNLPAEPESYTLSIDRKAITIVGRDSAGVFYGVQSLLALMPLDAGKTAALPRVDIADMPRAHWRGMEYDMARNFHGKAVTLRLIDQMAHYKLNKLHLHLTDDEGWRLQIPGLPQLTDIGAQRCFDLSETRCLLTQLGTGPFVSGSGNGYYSTQDFIDILKYAAARHIEIIPEIDMPGHSRAAITSMRARYKTLSAAGKTAAAQRYLLSDPADQSQYSTVQSYNDNSVNVCMESTYNFVDKIMYELQQMYRKAGLKLQIFHMGGDEVGAGSWTASPACNALFAKQPGVAGPADLKPYFVSRVAALASHRALAIEGWEDGLMYDATHPFNRAQFANKRVIANAWDNIWEWGVADRAYRLANAGYQVVLSHATHLYFDHPYEANPKQRGYYWAARATNTAKVFSYMPDNLYANADVTNNGDPIDNLSALVGRPLPKLNKPKNILGMQGNVWSETIRTPAQLENMIYPRLIALAERAWHKAHWEGEHPDASTRRASFARFSRTLVAKELPRLQRAGVNYHLLPPGGVVKNGKLNVNTALIGLPVEYSTDQGAHWQRYKKPFAVQGTLLLRTHLGEVTSATTSVTAP